MSYEQAWSNDLQASGQLQPAIPATPEGFPMGLVLNQRAVNHLFAQLADTALPQLSQSLTVFGQTVTLSMTPQIPLLQIGGDRSCPDCFTAGVPFNLGVALNNNGPSMGTGNITVQMPMGMQPVDDRRTKLVAGFQNLSVRTLQIDVGAGISDSVVSAIEPITNALLTAWLRSRFDNAQVASFDSWAIGRGDVLLAGRGPFVYPDQGTILIAMQSNLPIAAGASLQAQTTLPAGADVGFVFHPELLLSMTRRMNFEGVVPRDYSEDGVASANGSGGGIKVSIQQMRSQDDGLLRAGARLFSTDSLCGTADLSASLGLTIQPGQFAFTVQDVAVTGGEGVGQLFTQADWLTGGFVNALVDTLDVTVNYDQVFGGEAGATPEMGAFAFNIDGRGVSVYLNVLDL